jgi:EmrB/QacA subfamily drug resistance transporter
MTEPAAESTFVPLNSTSGRWILAAAVAITAAEFLSGLSLNVALPAVGAAFDADVSGLQWLANGYLLTLAALTFVGGALADRLGRRLILLVGTGWFAVATIAVALAPTLEFLIVMRVLQGVGAALLTPIALAIIEVSIEPDDRTRAIGAWSGLSGLAVAIGPAIAGALVDGVGWQGAFLIPIPLTAVAAYVATTHLTESRDETAHGRIDVAGGVLAVVGLGGLSYALIVSADAGWGSTEVIAGMVIAILGIVGFVRSERTAESPMVPLDMFANPQLALANAVTFIQYTSVGVVFFLVVIQLQETVGYSAFETGLAFIPVTAFMFVFGARSGQFAQNHGPRNQLLVGGLLFGVGQLMLVGLSEGASYVTEVLPAVVLLGLGLAALVPPITAWALAAASEDHAGAASGVNNAVAGTAELMSVAALPLIAGIGGGALAQIGIGFDRAMVVSAILSIVAGVIGWLWIDNSILEHDPDKHSASEWSRVTTAVRFLRCRLR